MNPTVVWVLRSAWEPLRVIFEDLPVLLVPVALSIHRDIYALRQLHQALALAAQSGRETAWDPWDASAKDAFLIPWILYVYLPSWLF